MSLPVVIFALWRERNTHRTSVGSPGTPRWMPRVATAHQRVAVKRFSLQKAQFSLLVFGVFVDDVEGGGHALYAESEGLQITPVGVHVLRRRCRTSGARQVHSLPERAVRVPPKDYVGGPVVEAAPGWGSRYMHNAHPFDRDCCVKQRRPLVDICGHGGGY